VNRLPIQTAAAIVIGGLLAAGCGRLPERVESLETARESVTSVEREPLAGRVAAEELAAAREALASADAAYEEREPLPLIEHRAYVAQRYADISRELVSEAEAREQVERAEAERTRIIAEAREREAEAARQAAAQASRELELTERTAEEQARAAQAAEQRASELEQDLADLQAQNTDRGLVLTLGDVLFDTGASTLKPGAMTTIDRLAQFMGDYPERSVRIEGHTDAVGSDETNQRLSEQRALAVRNALLARNVAPERVTTIGFGEARPIASNDTPAGRQQNRRVEVVVSDEQGSFGTGSGAGAAE
jgi:outer membrane protein OmpA-like peptidoglycan-associated protein